MKRRWTGLQREFRMDASGQVTALVTLYSSAVSVTAESSRFLFDPFRAGDTLRLAEDQSRARAEALWDAAMEDGDGGDGQGVPARPAARADEA